MNRLWIAIAVIALLIALCFAGAAAVTDRVGGVLSLLEKTRDAARRDDFTASAAFAEKAEEYWKSHAALLGSLLRHDEADSVTVQLAELRAYAETQDKDELIAVCAAAMRQLEHIREMEMPLVQNVL